MCCVADVVVVRSGCVNNADQIDLVDLVEIVTGGLSFVLSPILGLLLLRYFCFCL